MKNLNKPFLSSPFNPFKEIKTNIRFDLIQAQVFFDIPATHFRYRRSAERGFTIKKKTECRLPQP